MCRLGGMSHPGMYTSSRALTSNNTMFPIKYPMEKESLPKNLIFRLRKVAHPFREKRSQQRLLTALASVGEGPIESIPFRGKEACCGRRKIFSEKIIT